MDLADLDHETFERHAGERFTLRAGDGALELTLSSVTAGVAPADPQARTPFSLVFEGPAEPVAGQATYRLEHPELGALDVFVVPIGADADGAGYEAVFA